MEGSEGIKWELSFSDQIPIHWDWDLVTGNGEKMSKIKNGNRI